MATLAHAVARLASQVRPSGRRIGTIQAIDTTTGTLTVTMGGTAVEGVPWQASSYSPVVGDQVTILWDQNAGMLVTGTISTVRVADTEQVAIEVAPRLRTEVWLREGIDTQWQWRAAEDRTPYGFDMRQGRGWSTQVQTMIRYGAYLQYPPLASAIPAGATGTHIAIRIIRSWKYEFEPTLAAPVLYGHDQALPTSNEPGPVPSFATDAHRMGALTWGDEVIYPLSDSIQAGLLTGSLSGVAAFSEEETDYAYFLAWATDSYGQVGIPDGNANLIVTYTPPPES